MNPIILFDQDNVTVLLHDLRFDKEVDGVRASVEIQNRKGIGVHIILSDLWDGDRFYDDYLPSLCSVSQRSTQQENFLELNSTYGEEDHILKFHNGYRSAFSFRLALFTHRKGADTLKFCSKGRKIVVSKFSLEGVTVMPEDCYTIDSNSETIYAASEYYIPFEINKTDPQKVQMVQSFSDELIGRIRNLQIMSREVFLAKYGEIGKPRFYDVENMCIYNLGASTFSHCCPTDIAFSEMPIKEIEENKRKLGATEKQKCYYAYKLVLREELENICNSKQLIAEWSHIDVDMTIANTPRRYWESIRRQFERVFVHQALSDPIKDHFGLQVTVHLPKQLLPAGVMKPLLDGIVCAFHGRDGIDDILQAITQDSFDRMVNGAENSIAVLGNRNYVQPYRDGFKWNPADERLKFAWVSVVAEDCESYFEGKLFVWS